MQPVSGLFFDFRLLLFQLLDDTALLYGALDGQRVVHGGFLTAVDTETGKGTCREMSFVASAMICRLSVVAAVSHFRMTGRQSDGIKSLP